MDEATHNLDSLSGRLNYALELTGTRKADLARAIDVKPQVIQFLCSSSTKASRFSFEIATALGLSVRWLATGEGTMFLADDPRHKLFESCRRVPILTTEQVLQHQSYKDIDLTHHDDWTVITHCSKNNVFCIKVSDNAMEPTLPINAYVFVEENLNAIPEDHDIILVHIKPYNMLTFRETLRQNDTTIFAPKNRELYKETEFSEDTRIIGVAIECHWPIRR